jgi:uncharacterized protein with GYD domain
MLGLPPHQRAMSGHAKNLRMLAEPRSREDPPMPKYLVEASYTAEGLKGLQRDRASGRRDAIKKAVEGLGGKIEAMYYALGDHDVLVVLDLPSTIVATRLAIAVSASGLVRTKTTALLTVEEADEALGGGELGYRAPGT